MLVRCVGASAIPRFRKGFRMRFGLTAIFLGWVLGLPLQAQAHVRSCIEEADDHGSFTIFQAQRLCAGSLSTAPADCGNFAARYMPTEQAVSLCTYAQSDAPVQCASAA